MFQSGINFRKNGELPSLSKSAVEAQIATKRKIV
jgi:hypothetical protein